MSARKKTDRPLRRRWTDDREDAPRLWGTLARCHATYGKAIAAKVQTYGLTVPQFGILEALYHLGPLPLGAIAERLLVTGANVTFVMDKLEAQGLAQRDRHAEDRRVVLARLTPEGRARMEEVFSGHAAYVQGLARHLTAEEQKTLSALLRKLGTGIETEDL
jgi:MarR family 2-MHQ and catechol resistance regulon transcriptional repressor